MSKTTLALEVAVAAVIENMPKDGAKQTNRQRVNVDRAFAQILKLIAPRIRHFVRQYGLLAHFEDAEQCCAIAVHRAIESYDPAKAQFTTFVNWQIRGELQSLRFRVMTDQRPSARKVEATTISLNSLVAGEGEEGATEVLIEDEGALGRTEAAAADYLAEGAVGALLDAYVDHLRAVGTAQLERRPRAVRRIAEQDGPRFRRPAPIEEESVEKLDARLVRDREIVERRILDTATLDEISEQTGVTKERVRQITKRAAQTMAEIAATDSRFQVMADQARTVAIPAKPARRSRAAARPTVTLLPDANALHNRLSSVTAIEAATVAEANGHALLPALTAYAPAAALLN